MGKCSRVRCGNCDRAAGAAAYLGLQAPMLFLKNAISKRQLSIKRAFPDALDLLLICVESGMSIESAFTRVAGEIGSQSAELAEELAGVRGERLDVAPLPLCVDRVERQRALAGTGQAAEHDELVAREFERHVLEVVFTGAADDDLVGHGATP